MSCACESEKGAQFTTYFKLFSNDLPACLTTETFLFLVERHGAQE